VDAGGSTAASPSGRFVAQLPGERIWVPEPGQAHGASCVAPSRMKVWVTMSPPPDRWNIASRRLWRLDFRNVRGTMKPISSAWLSARLKKRTAIQAFVHKTDCP